MTTTKHQDQASAVKAATLVASTIVVSQPGAVVRVERIELTKEAARTLRVNRLPSVMPKKR